VIVEWLLLISIPLIFDYSSIDWSACIDYITSVKYAIYPGVSSGEEGWSPFANVINGALSDFALCSVKRIRRSALAVIKLTYANLSPK